MIADLDPVIIVELASEAAIHRCIENFVLPTHPHQLQPPEKGMTIIILKLQLSICMCVSVCLSTPCQYCLPLLGATEQESRKNFITWLNMTIKRNSNQRANIALDSRGEEQEGCYENMTCSDLQKVVAVFAELTEWRYHCTTTNCSAGKFYTVTGDESKMTITRQRVGPFL